MTSIAMAPDDMAQRSAIPDALRTVAAAALLALACYLSARFGVMYALVGSNASPVWPPAGIAVAALYLGGRRLWPGIALGAVVANLANGAAPAGTAMAALGATAEALIAVELLRRSPFRPQLDRLIDVPLLAIAGSALPAAAGATIAVAGLALTGSIPGDDVTLAWVGWWVGDCLSILVIGALLLTWLTPTAYNALRRRPVESAIALGAVTGVSFLLFFDLLDLAASGQSVAFPIIPLVVWVAFRIGPRGATLAALIFSAIAIAATQQGLGPFVGTSRESTLLYLAVFVALVALSGDAVAAVVAERDADRASLADAGRLAAEALTRLQAIELIGRTLAAQGPTQVALQSVVDALADVFGYSHPSIYTGDERLMRLGAQRGYARPILEITGSSGVQARVMRTRATEFLPDVSRDPEFLRVDPGVTSEIAVPLLSHGELFGLLNVESRRPLDARDLASVTVVADRVAAALALAFERAHLAELAIRDGLTGLHNRRYFDDALLQLEARLARDGWSGGRPVAVVMFDLDLFGDFNNHHGHQVGDDVGGTELLSQDRAECAKRLVADVNKVHGVQVGDEVLRAFGRILRERFRTSDIVARYGGEEFIAILPGATLEDATRVAEEVRTKLAETAVPGSDGRPLSVTVSSGCAVAEGSGEALEGLIRRADAALAMAKSAGRNRVAAA
jgi:diguanylate cyclase (GGDEF)-like protein